MPSPSLQARLGATLLFALLVLVVAAPAGATDPNCIVDGFELDDCGFLDVWIGGDGPVGGGGGEPLEYPNLTASAGFSFGPLVLRPGDPFVASVVIDNLGGTYYTSGEIRVDFYLSPLGNDALLSGNRIASADIVLPDYTSVGDDPVFMQVPIEGLLPETLDPGQYRLAVHIDAGDVLDETSELDNKVAAGDTITIGGTPDLQPTSQGATITSPVAPDQPLTIQARVKNGGAGPVTGPVTIAVRYRAVPAGGDELGGTVLGTNTLTLGAGVDISPNGQALLPAFTTTAGLPPGDYEIWVDVDFADPDDAVAEADEANNSGFVGSLGVLVGPGTVDYTFEPKSGKVESDYLAGKIAPGWQLLMKAVGIAKGYRFNPYPEDVVFVASTDLTFTYGDRQLERVEYDDPLDWKPDVPQDILIGASWPDLPPGTYHIGAILFAGPGIDSNPNNNTLHLGSIKAVQACAKTPTYREAEAVFSQIYLSGGVMSLTGVNGEFCTGGKNLQEDHDYFNSVTLDGGDSCNMLLSYIDAVAYVTDGLLPQMQQLCIGDLAGLVDQAPTVALQAKERAKQLRTALAKAKRVCDRGARLHPWIAKERAYCTCDNADFIYWLPTGPHPGDAACVYAPN
jgi:hypothetical protein